MLKLVIILILASAVLAADIDNVARDLKSKSGPLNGFHVNIDVFIKQYLGKNSSTKLPISVGIGYDRVNSKLRLPFITTIFDSKKTFQTDTQTYLIPDQITLVKTSDDKITKSLTFDDFDEFVKYVSGSKMENGFAVGSYVDYSQLLDFLGSGTQTVMLSSISYPRANLKLDLALAKIDPQIVSVLRDLPETYDESAYFKFIEYWGTDLIISATIGGFVEQISMFKSCEVNGVNFASEGQMQMLKQLYAKAYGNVELSAKYLAYSRTNSLLIRGGNPILNDMSEFESREKSFSDYPVYIDVETVPISDFFPKGPIQNNMIRAIESYSLKKHSYVTDLKNKWQSRLTKPQRIVSAITYDGLVSIDQNVRFLSITPGQVVAQPFCERFLTENIYFYTCMANNGFNDRVCRTNSINYVVIQHALQKFCHERQQPMSCRVSGDYVQATFGSVVGPLVKHGCSIAVNPHDICQFDSFHPIVGKTHMCCKDVDLAIVASQPYNMAVVATVCKPF
jgi:hypothetical protein